MTIWMLMYTYCHYVIRLGFNKTKKVFRQGNPSVNLRIGNKKKSKWNKLKGQNHMKQNSLLIEIIYEYYY